jgi:hypothetical protein
LGSTALVADHASAMVTFVAGKRSKVKLESFVVWNTRFTVFL